MYFINNIIICATVHSTFEILCNDNNWMSSLEVNSQETLHMVHLDVGSSWDCNLSVLSESLDFDHFGIWFAQTNKYNMATLCSTTFCFNITYKSLQIATSSVSHHASTQNDPSPTCKIVATPILRFGWMLRSLRMIPSQQINGVIVLKSRLSFWLTHEFTKLQIPEILGHVYGSQCFVLWRWRWNNAKPCKQTNKQKNTYNFLFITACVTALLAKEGFSLPNWSVSPKFPPQKFLLRASPCIPGTLSDSGGKTTL